MTPLLSIRDAAKLLGISESTMRSHVSCRRIAHRRIGGAIRFTEQDIQSFVEESKVDVRTALVKTPKMAPLKPFSAAEYKAKYKAYHAAKAKSSSS
jgi:excisionase family DNA binding protein